MNERIANPLHRRAFTLFEVALSLGIVATAVLSVLLIFPVGIKAQQLARFRLYAAIKAEEMIEVFNAVQNGQPAIDSEAFNAWDVPVGYRSNAWDLEHRLSTHQFGLMPVPTDITTRIDSDDDEIQRILAEGGQLYYSSPMATTSFEETHLAAAPPNETQRLIFAVSGYAQNNSVYITPQKNWPYNVPWPSPPMHGLHSLDYLPAGSVEVNTIGAGSPVAGLPIRYHWPKAAGTAGIAAPGYHGYCWEATSDPDIAKVFFSKDASLNPCGFLPYSYGREPDDGWVETFPGGLHPDGSASTAGPNDSSTDPSNAIRYVQAALWYCEQKLPGNTAFWNPAFPTTAGDFEGGTLMADRWKQVQAMRFLSHAASTLTRWIPYGTLNSTGITIPAAVLDGVAGPASFVMRADHLRYYHDRAFNLVMKYAAENPYDWNVPRPAQRTLMNDFPLIEYDLFSPPKSGRIFDVTETGGPAAAQWEPIPAQPVLQATNQLQSFSLPSRLIPNDATTWGDTSHFTLTAPFAAEERCRQIVCWAVDWMSYEDAELAPSAQVDASKYPMSAPKAGRSFAARMSDLQFIDGHLYVFRNPEKAMLFTSDVSAMATGADVSGQLMLNSSAAPDQGASAAAKQVFSGAWGADRNFNKKLDRGPVPRSVRMRAVLVGRFNFYDPRIPALVQ